MQLEYLIKIGDDLDDVLGLVKLSVTPTGFAIMVISALCLITLIFAPTGAWSIAAIVSAGLGLLVRRL